MTGAEFASRYTVLKPLDQRAVRSFVAQEQSTRRAVMVHWLDQLSASDRTAMLARLDRLPGEARERVLGVESVDGSPVIVTRMILDFESFGKWLDRVAPPTQAPAPPPPPPSKGGFTDIFVASGPQRGAPVAEIESPTVSWTPPSVQKTPPAPPPEPKSEPKAPAKNISVRFREPGSNPKPAPPAPPPAAALPPKPPPPPKAPPPRPPAPGEFTQIFGATHAEPDPVPPAPQFMPPPAMPSGGGSGSPSATSAMERMVAPAPRPAAPPPPPAPSPSSPWSGPPPVVPLAPTPSGSATPMPGANINLPPSAPVMSAQPVQSDFTRIIGAAGPSPALPVTPVPSPAPAPAPAPTPAPVAAANKKIVGVVLGFGALVLAALVLVVVALIRHR